MAERKIDELHFLTNLDRKTLSRHCRGVTRLLITNAITQCNYPNEFSAPIEIFNPSTKTEKLFSAETFHDLIFLFSNRKMF